MNTPTDRACCAVLLLGNATTQQLTTNDATGYAPPAQQAPTQPASLLDMARNKLRNNHATGYQNSTQQAHPTSPMVAGDDLTERACCAVALPRDCDTQQAHDNDAETHWHWHIALPDREIKAYFNPEASFDKVMADYPLALAAEPMPERTRRKASPQEAAELRQLVTSCATELVDAGRTVEGYGLLRTGYRDGWTAAEVEEALRVALADAALTCWRLLAPVNADEADQRN